MDGIAIGFASVILTLGVLPLSLLFYLHKIKTKKMDTLIKIVELGGNVDPEMMNMLSGSGGNYKTDYKIGMIWLALGVPITLGIWMENSYQEAVFGTIAIFIGIAFLISGKYRLRESS